MDITNAQILVTGATGLVGGHMVERLMEAGARVYAAQRSINPESYLVKKGLAERVTLLPCDVTDLEQVKKMLEACKPDYIFHLAGQLRVPSVYETLATNISGTINMLEAVRQRNDVKAVFLSSSHRAYVGANVNPAVFAKLPKNVYDLSKTVSELAAWSFIQQYDLPVVVARFGNAFGPGDLLKRVVPVIIDKILHGGRFEIQGSGNVVKNYVYVKDIVEGYVLMLEHSDDIIKKPVNFITDWNFSVTELAKKISDVLGKPIDYEVVGDISAEIPLQISEGLDPRKAFDWQPTADLDSAIRETVKWYNKKSS